MIVLAVLVSTLVSVHAIATDTNSPSKEMRRCGVVISAAKNISILFAVDTALTELGEKVRTADRTATNTFFRVKAYESLAKLFLIDLESHCGVGGNNDGESKEPLPVALALYEDVAKALKHIEESVALRTASTQFLR